MLYHRSNIMIMKTIATITLACMCLGAFAQNGSVQGESGAFYLDFASTKSNNISVPQIVWKNPAVQQTQINTRKYKLQLNIRSSKKLKDVRVYLNDFPVVRQRGFSVVSVKSLSEHERVVDTEVLLRPGKNTIRVTATNNEEETSASFREINVTATNNKKLNDRKDIALLFATDNYDNWDNLENPINDVETIGNDLQAIYGFEVEIVKNATKREVLQKLREYTKKTYLPDDQMFIMFAGHGYYDQLFNQGYLVCRDSKITDEERLSYISHSNLRGIIDNIPNKHIFLAIDACFGGTFDPYIRSSAHRGGISDDYEQNKYISRKLKLKTRKFLTSGGKEYVSDGRPGQHSPFVRKMLEAIRSFGGDDDVLTLSEIKSYVEKIDPEPRFGEFGSDQPGSDFIFIVK